MTVLELLFLTVFWTWVVSAVLFLRTTALPRSPIPQLPNDLRQRLETVRFSATDGLRLEGWKLAQQEPGAPWIILCHGLGTNRADVLDIGLGLFRAGLNIFLFDFRGHGGSEGRAASFGYQEQRDLAGALAFLGSQPDAPPRPYGVYGISMGGAVALLVAARDERIGALAVDSSYADLDRSIDRHLQLMYPFVPRIPFSWFVQSAYRLRFGVWPREVSPRRSATKLGRRPLLVIHGAQDHRMPPRDATAIVEYASRQAALWLVEGVDHLGAFAADPGRYVDRLVGFFKEALI